MAVADNRWCNLLLCWRLPGAEILVCARVIAVFAPATANVLPRSNNSFTSGKIQRQRVATVKTAFGAADRGRDDLYGVEFKGVRVLWILRGRVGCGHG